MYRGNWFSSVLLGRWASFDNFKKKVVKAVRRLGLAAE